MKEFIQIAGTILSMTLCVLLFAPLIGVLLKAVCGFPSGKTKFATFVDNLKLPRWLLTLGYAFVVVIAILYMIY